MRAQRPLKTDLADEDAPARLLTLIGQVAFVPGAPLGHYAILEGTISALAVANTLATARLLIDADAWAPVWRAQLHELITGSYAVQETLRQRTDLVADYRLEAQLEMCWLVISLCSFALAETRKDEQEWARQVLERLQNALAVIAIQSGNLCDERGVAAKAAARETIEQIWAGCIAVSYQALANDRRRAPPAAPS